jgi:hypothetical protein
LNKFNFRVIVKYIINLMSLKYPNNLNNLNNLKRDYLNMQRSKILNL